MTTAIDTKISAFQQRCLRRILKIDPAYYSRVKNVEVLAKANTTVSKLKRTTEDWIDHLAQGDLARAKIKTTIRHTCSTTSKIVSPHHQTRRRRTAQQRIFTRRASTDNGLQTLGTTEIQLGETSGKRRLGTHKGTSQPTGRLQRNKRTIQRNLVVSNDDGNISLRA